MHRTEAQFCRDEAARLGAGQQVPQDLSVVFLILDDQYALAHHAPACRAHRQEREETEREERLHDRVSKDAIKSADKAIDALAEQHRAKHPGLTHAQCVAHVITATEEGKRLYAEQAGTPAQGDADHLMRTKAWFKPSDGPTAQPE
jgi:hypothetical protein